MTEKKKVVYIAKRSPSVITVKGGNAEIKIVDSVPKELKE